MPEWKVAAKKPGGSLPEGLLNKIMVGLGTVLILALVLSTGFCGGGDEEADADPGEAAETGAAVRPAQPVDRQLQDVIQRQEALRDAARQRDARDAAEQQRRAAEAADAVAATDPYASIPPSVQLELMDSLGRLPDPDVLEIQRQADLEEVARRITSLRASPLALSYRGQREPRGGGETTPAVQLPPSPDLLAALPGGGAPLPGQGARPPAGELEIPPPSTARLPDYETPPHLLTPADPPGWERVYEGNFLEAVLVTQLDGEFPGPVLASVSVPFYSADRQRVLIPRGARLIGSAQAVTRRDQAALAVGFHRLVFPDGRHVPLRFIALGKEGETGLRDQVDRHYLSTFLTAGAVGILSGFATVRGNPYGGGAQGALGSAGAGLAGTGGQVLDRFLNRLPTITIRAGHRLRVWFTTDVLVPRPPSR